MCVRDRIRERLKERVGSNESLREQSMECVISEKQYWLMWWKWSRQIYKPGIHTKTYCYHPEVDYFSIKALPEMILFHSNLPKLLILFIKEHYVAHFKQPQSHLILQKTAH